MGRSGYDDSCDGWDLIRWRGAVASAIRGKRGQAFLREMLDALDAMPEKRLIAHDLIDESGCVCAMGAVGLARGMYNELHTIDAHDRRSVADAFGIAKALSAEIAYENDGEAYYWRNETPEQRFVRVRAWVAAQIVQREQQGGT